MLKVCLLVLGSVSLLPFAVQAMEEGDGWSSVPAKSIAKEGKGKEKEKEKEHIRKPQLERTFGGLHFSQVTGVVRKKSPAAKEESKQKASKPSDLNRMLEQAQGEKERFVSRMQNLVFQSSEIESIIYPACNMKRGIPVGDLYVTPKQGDEVIRIIKHATHPVFVKKSLNKLRRGEALDPKHMEHYTQKAMIKRIPDSVHPKVFAHFDGVVIGNYEGTTVQTKNKQEGSNDYQGKVLAFKLGITDDQLGDIDLSYPNKDDRGNSIMLPVKMTLDVIYNENKK